MYHVRYPFITISLLYRIHHSIVLTRSFILPPSRQSTIRLISELHAAIYIGREEQKRGSKTRAWEIGRKKAMQSCKEEFCEEGTNNLDFTQYYCTEKPPKASEDNERLSGHTDTERALSHPMNQLIHQKHHVHPSINNQSSNKTYSKRPRTKNNN